MNPIRVAWAIVVLVGIAGYVLTVEPNEQRARAAAFHAHELYELTSRNERMLRNAAALAAARRRVASDLEILSAQNTSGRVALAAVHVLELQAQTHHVAVSSFAPEGGDAGAAQPVTVGLRGAYRDVLGVVAELSTRDALFEIQGAELRQTTAHGPSGVEATLHVRLYHGIEALTGENEHDRTAGR